MKRLTRDQKEAVSKFWRTVAAKDNYLSSVFVSAAQTAYYDRLLAEREADCVALGVSQSFEIA